MKLAEKTNNLQLCPRVGEHWKHPPRQPPDRLRHAALNLER
jgi:hypothetical protein